MSVSTMYKMGVLATVENGLVTVRPDFDPHRLLLEKKHLRKPSLALYNPPPSQDDSCSTVGATCNGLTVIGVTGTNSSSLSMDVSAAADATVNYDVYGSYAQFGDAVYDGAIYYITKLANCTVTATQQFASDMWAVAEAFIGGGLIASYTSADQTAAIVGSATQFVNGEISAAAFWDVLAAVASTVSLPEILAAAAVSTTVAIGFRAAKCTFGG